MRAILRIRFIFPLIALAVVVALQVVRIRRLQQLTSLPEWSVDSPTPEASSPTGYSHQHRSLLVPDRMGQSQQWIAQTQQMLAEGKWRIEHVDYDNAPLGRETRLPGIYRLWLASLSWIYGAITSSSSGVAVERVALFADPLLQILTALTTGWFVIRHFGSLAGILVTAALVSAYPLATNFIPGAPNPQGLMETCVLWSVLPLVAGFGLTQKKNFDVKSDRLFFIAGAAGGIGLWLNANTQLSVLAGTVAGAIAYIYLSYGAPENRPLPWRKWALGGCVVSLAGYMADYFPSRMTLRLDVNHPLYALAWLAAGEVLHQLNRWNRQKSGPLRLGRLIATGLLLLGLGTVAFLWLSHRVAILSSDMSASQLSRLDDGFSAPSFVRLVAINGFSLQILALILPVTLVVGLCIPLLGRSVPIVQRAAVAFVLGPIALTFLFAVEMLRWWNTLESVALVAWVVVITLTAEAKSRIFQRWIGIGGVGAAVWIGLLQLVPPASFWRSDEFTPSEMQKMVERDLAHWLSQRHPGAVVLAPASLTTPLWFHGGLRGITTIDVDNNAGLEGAVRISAALTQQEAFVLMQNRQVSYIVLPSWDLGLNQSARIAVEGNKSLFIEQLRNWIFPLWIRPVAYFSPSINGFESRSVLVLEVVEPQSEPMLISQLATYFIEANLPGIATELLKSVSRFPTNMSTLITRAEIEYATDDHAAFSQALTSVVTALERKADRALAWDRRVALAAVLAEGNRDDLARVQISRCFAEVDETRLRFLSPRSLFHFLMIGKNYGLTVADPHLRQLALQLLPPDSRPRVQ